MTDTSALPLAPPPPVRPGPSWWRHGLACLGVVLAVTLAGWYLLADPDTSPLEVYPMPFNAVLFWALMFVVWSGFNLELAGFDRLPQPARGIALTGATVAFAIGVTWVLGTGLGAIYPDLAADRAGGAGYFAGALFVLFGFSTYVLVVVNWAHWPWPDIGLRQPWVGLCELAFLLLPTTLLWLVLGVPAVAGSVGTAPLGIDALLGWYYCIVVAIVVTGLTLENWPWRLVGSRARIAAVSLIGNVALGTVLFVVLRAVCRLLISPETVTALGGAIDQFPSQLGVCWVAWMIVWANAFENRPISLGTAANHVARVAITFALAVGTFALYYYVLAERVLHEPAVAGSLSGNALGFMDWFALVALVFIVGFEAYPLRRPTTPQSSTDDEPVVGASHPQEVPS
jgi:AAT family amino acid transporter